MIQNIGSQDDTNEWVQRRGQVVRATVVQDVEKSIVVAIVIIIQIAMRSL